jgi:hypothetical protein
MLGKQGIRDLGRAAHSLITIYLYLLEVTLLERKGVIL